MTDPIQTLIGFHYSVRHEDNECDYCAALSQVKALVRAAQWTVGTAILPQKRSRTVHVLRDSTDALAAALTPFKENT